MPRRKDAPSIGAQLAGALQATGVSVSELARRLAAPDGPTAASKRRWLQKILNDEVDQPDMAGIERALSLPVGHFRLPEIDQLRRRRARLEELEAAVAADRQLILKLTRLIGRLQKQIEGLIEKVEALESAATPRQRASGGR